MKDTYFKELKKKNQIYDTTIDIGKEIEKTTEQTYEEKLEKYKKINLNFGKYKDSNIYTMLNSNNEDYLNYLEWLYKSPSINKGLKIVIEFLITHVIEK